MAYVKTTWANGDVIDATKLNNLEDGVAANDTAISGLGPVDIAGSLDGDTGAITLTDTTAADLYDLVSAGKSIKVTFSIGSGDAYVILNVSTQLAGSNYDFSCIVGTGDIYASGHLASTDPVVLSPVSP